jgi:hypothetical protein
MWHDNIAHRHMWVVILQQIIFMHSDIMTDAVVACVCRLGFVSLIILYSRCWRFTSAVGPVSAVVRRIGVAIGKRKVS